MDRILCYVNLFGLKMVLLSVGLVSALSGCNFERKTAQTVERVVIKSNWAGLPPHAELVETNVELSRKGRRFVGTSQSAYLDRVLPSQELIIPEAKIQQLLDAAQSKEVKIIDTQEFWDNPDFIQESIDNRIEEFILNVPSAEHASIRAYRDTLYSDRRLAEMLTEGIRNSYHFDDYPRIELRITFLDGTDLKASSNSQDLMMLPWVLDGNVETFSTQLPQAVSKILPEGAVNKDRLMNARNLDDYLDWIVANGMKIPLNFAVFEGLAPKANRQLASHFIVSDIEYSSLGCKDLICFTASIQLPSQPENLIYRTILPVVNGAILKENLERFAETLKRVNESSAMLEIIRSNPNQEYKIQGSFCNNPEMVRQYVKEMTANRKNAAVPNDSATLKNAVLINQKSKYWVVFPGGRVVLWKQLKVDGNNIIGTPCYKPPNDGGMESYDMFEYQCVGNFLY